MRTLLLTFVFSLLLPLLLLPLAAAATPVSVSVEPWKTVDGNFGFSVIHAATGGHMERAGMDFYAGGAKQYEVSAPTQTLSGHLEGLVLTLDGGSLALDGGASLEVKASVLDFGVAEGEAIGALGYALVDAGTVEHGDFFFYNFDYTNGSCDANGMCADGQYRLWGNNWDNGVADRPEGNVLVDGQRVTVHRGIDLGGDISAAVPEPSAALLFGVGALVAGRATRRR